MSEFVHEYAFAEPSVAKEHFAHKLSFETDPSDVYADLTGGDPSFVLIDVRSPEAFAKAHAKGAISIPHRLIGAQTVPLELGQDLVVYCWGPACNAAGKAGFKFASLGYKVKEMIGGFEYWCREGLPIEGTHLIDPDLYGLIRI